MLAGYGPFYHKPPIHVPMQTPFCTLPQQKRLLQLLLGSELVGMTALLLTAVGGARRETSLSSPLAAALLTSLCLVGEMGDARVVGAYMEDLRSTFGRSSCRSCTLMRVP